MIETYSGDTKSITVILKQNGEELDFVNGDIITFTVKKNLSQEIPTIEKIVTSFVAGRAIINLTSIDTEIEAGSYMYDIQYDKENGERHTIIVNEFIVKLELA